MKHVYYTYLTFGANSGARVMRAHLRTEYLQRLEKERKINVMVIREGLYNSSWPLYLGYFDSGVVRGERDEVVVAGNGKVGWTSIGDLGLGTASVLSERGWKGKTFYLASMRAPTLLEEIAGIRVKFVGREEYVRYYVGRAGMRQLSSGRVLLLMLPRNGVSV